MKTSGRMESIKDRNRPQYTSSAPEGLQFVGGIWLDLRRLCTSISSLLMALDSLSNYVEVIFNEELVELELVLSELRAFVKSCSNTQSQALREPIYQRDLMRELDGYFVKLSRRLEKLNKYGFTKIDQDLKEQKKKMQAENLSLLTAAVFFSSITASTLQLSISQRSKTYDIVNFLWFTSLVFSIASAMNSLLASTSAWKHAIFRRGTINESMPFFIEFWSHESPLYFLFVAALTFIIGLCLLGFASDQARWTSSITTILTGLSIIGIFRATAWFIAENRRFASHSGGIGSVICKRFKLPLFAGGFIQSIAHRGTNTLIFLKKVILRAVGWVTSPAPERNASQPNVIDPPLFNFYLAPWTDRRQDFIHCVFSPNERPVSTNPYTTLAKRVTGFEALHMTTIDDVFGNTIEILDNECRVQGVAFISWSKPKCFCRIFRVADLSVVQTHPVCTSDDFYVGPPVWSPLSNSFLLQTDRGTVELWRTEGDGFARICNILEDLGNDGLLKYHEHHLLWLPHSESFLLLDRTIPAVRIYDSTGLLTGECTLKSDVELYDRVSISESFLVNNSTLVEQEGRQKLLISMTSTFRPNRNSYYASTTQVLHELLVFDLEGLKVDSRLAIFDPTIAFSLSKIGKNEVELLISFDNEIANPMPASSALEISRIWAIVKQLSDSLVLFLVLCRETNKNRFVIWDRYTAIPLLTFDNLFQTGNASPLFVNPSNKMMFATISWQSVVLWEFSSETEGIQNAKYYRRAASYAI
ncbi:hypothetical protein SCHPADRAFT_943809 [Schizopora paradoxa]|uniref:WD40 repeat-like protein n=1 Tax=Schizopora paradoxa TaxID=27342 RepID=A0A0H2RWJ0_9AGAM|nr:hypothetical protein SCHPADRAFT_943809 [Schizopora paradoxa]